MKHEDVPENKEIFVYGFKHIKTDKIDSYILIGCESDGIIENDKLFSFITFDYNKHINEEIENRDFEITGWPFMTSVERNIFFKIQSVCLHSKVFAKPIRANTASTSIESFHLSHILK